MTYVDGINPTAMDKFLGALESGKYEQGTHRLHTAMSDSMCCLGVASAELGPDCGVKLIEHDPSMIGRLYFDEATQMSYYLLMPPSVTKLLGIPENFVRSGPSGDYILVWASKDEVEMDTFDDMEKVSGRPVISVSSLNDHGSTFIQIAKRIRETFTKEEN